MTEQRGSPWWAPGRWFASPHYWEKPVQETMPFRPARVFVKDATLREGEETPGVVFTLRDRVEIALRLQALGVTELEMPVAASPREQRELLQALDDAGVTLPKSYLVPNQAIWKDDIDRKIDFGARSLTVLAMLPQPPFVATKRRSLSLEEVLEHSLAAIEYCRAQGIRIAVGTPGATRVPLQALVDFHRRLAEAGEDRVHIYDSMGIGTPASIRHVIQRIKQVVGRTPVLFHCHNDLGMATANTLSGVEGGAEWVDVVANGLGDRAGNASLEEVVMALEMCGFDTGINLERLSEFSSFVEEKTGVRLQPHKAIVGRNAFLEESAPHFLMSKEAEAAGVPEAPVPYVPEVIGRRHVLVFGSTTLYGGVIEYKLDEWGYRYTTEQLEEIRARASERIATQGTLSEDEFQAVCVGVLGGPA